MNVTVISIGMGFTRYRWMNVCDDGAYDGLQGSLTRRLGHEGIKTSTINCECVH